MSSSDAPGAPGGEPHWSSSAKSGVGRALEAAGRCAFTIGRGIINEIYYPRLDHANTRDMGFIVTGGDEPDSGGKSAFFSEEQHHATHEIRQMLQGVPAYEIVSRDPGGRYRITKRILTDPDRAVLLQWTKFESLQEGDWRLYILLNPHIANHGQGNTAWQGDYKGHPQLLASRGDVTLALGCSVPFLQRSVGFAGVSDGWQDLKRHGEMRWNYQRAQGGNVALMGRIDWEASPEFLLAVGFGRNAAEAGQRVVYCINDGWEDACRRYTGVWRQWQRPLNDPEGDVSKEAEALYRTSAMVLRVHESQNFPGGIIASLSIPWGSAKGDDDIGGYHQVWTRDMVQAAGALMAIGADAAAVRALSYLRVSQEADGHWPQVMWMDGTAARGGIQMDETALPALLVHFAHREKIIEDEQLNRFGVMLRRAAGYLLRRGPESPQDRWENSSGYNTFTLASEIVAMLTVADCLERTGQDDVGSFLRQTADLWNACIERWTYVRGTDLAKRCGVDGYYVRITPPSMGGVLLPGDFNEVLSQSGHPAAEVVSPDALALVRFGLRRPDDPRILNTIRVIDATLKTDTPFGPGWHRYQGDNYGETDDGGPFIGRDGGGHGRLWPLLTGERGHYELAAGRPDRARELLKTMGQFAGDGLLLPEQVWDSADLPEQGLFCGRPSGSAMPLVWAHAEYVKLCRSLRDGKVFDMPQTTRQRYVESTAPSKRAAWRFSHPFDTMPGGLMLRLEVHAAAMIRYSTDDWNTVHDVKTTDTHLGLHYADLPADSLKSGARVDFTFHWAQADRWEGRNFTVNVQ